MDTPGNTAIHGPSRNSGWALASMTPSDGVGGRTPSPRKESTASPMMAAGAATVACTIRVLTALGRMWRRSTTPSLAPSAMAAATKSSPRRRSVSPRVTRTTCGICATPMAMVAVANDGPRIAASPTASTRNGNASSVSVSRDTTGSRTL